MLYTAGDFCFLIKHQAGKKDDKSLREKENEIQLLLSQGITGLGTDITLNDIFEFYIAHKKHKGKKLTDNTVYNYRSMYKLYVENSILGNMKISDIKRINITYFYEQLQEKRSAYQKSTGRISFIFM